MLITGLARLHRHIYLPTDLVFIQASQAAGSATMPRSPVGGILAEPRSVSNMEGQYTRLC